MTYRSWRLHGAAHLSAHRPTRLPGRQTPAAKVIRRIRHMYRHSPLCAVSALGWVQSAASALCLAAFFTFGWHEMLAIGLFSVTSLLIAVLMSLGNTGFHASIVTGQRRVRVGDDVAVRVSVDTPSPPYPCSLRGSRSRPRLGFELCPGRCSR